MKTEVKKPLIVSLAMIALLIMLMVLCLMPTMASAAEPVEITTYAQLKTALEGQSGGDYILKNDIEYTFTSRNDIGNNGIYVKADVTLDLNGKTLKYKRATINDSWNASWPYTTVMTVKTNAEFTVLDSSTNKDGKITLTELPSSVLSIIAVEEFGTFNLKSGKLEGNGGDTIKSLGGDKRTYINISGGTVSGNDEIGKSCIWLGKNTDLTMTGGTLSNLSYAISAVNGQTGSTLDISNAAITTKWLTLRLEDPTTLASFKDSTFLHTGTSAPCIWNEGTIDKITNCTITSSNHNPICNDGEKGKGIINEISGGILDAKAAPGIQNRYGAVITDMKGVTIKSPSNCIYNYESTISNIEDCTMDSVGYATVYLSGGSIAINGGKYTGSYACAVYAENNGKININGGYYRGWNDEYDSTFYADGSSEIIIPDGYILSNKNLTAEEIQQNKLGTESYYRLFSVKNVRNVNTQKIYPSLTEALADLFTLDGHTLEVINDYVEPADVEINKNVTIVSDAKARTVELENSSILVKKGKSLTLGDGSENRGLLTFHTDTAEAVNNETIVHVTDGTITVNDGVALTSETTAFALLMNGSTATGKVAGGKFSTKIHAIDISGEAKLTEISSGDIHGGESALHMTGEGTRIDVISGGKFTNNAATGRSLVYVQNKSDIGSITGGTFTATSNSALLITRGGWVETISGGEFVSNDNTPNVLYMGISVRNDASDEAYGKEKTGVGTITKTDATEPSFSGKIAMWVGGNAEVGKIEAGTFTGSGSNPGIQFEKDTKLGSITGGNITGFHAFLNRGTIGEIGGTVYIQGDNSGLWNTGTITEIKGGTIIGHTEYPEYGYSSGTGIANDGKIGKISGGTFVGGSNAVVVSGNSAKLDTISGGTFWGMENVAIQFSSVGSVKVKLEPQLGENDELVGYGRYWGASYGNPGNIFSDESYIIYPDGYVMSDTATTLPVDKITIPGATLENKSSRTDFRYLTKTFDLIYDTNGGNADGPATVPGLAPKVGYALDSATIPTHNDVDNKKVVFLGWTKEQTTTIFSKNDTAPEIITQVDIKDSSVTVYAAWGYDVNGNGEPDVKEDKYQVSYDANGGEGTTTDDNRYLKSETVTVKANGFTRAEHNFVGWNTAADGSGTGYAPGDEFSMPESNVTLYAQWKKEDKYQVSYDANGGEGTTTDNNRYLKTETVTVKANGFTRAEHSFIGWNTAADGSGTGYAPGDEFSMPESNVTLYAQWKKNESPVYAPDSAVLLKVDADDNSTTLYGAEFELYSTFDGNDTLIGTYTTDNNGMIIVPGLSQGSYYWVEIGAPEGYRLDASKYEFAVDAEEAKVTTVTNKRSVPEWLNGLDHYAYIVGYPDGNIHPQADITRAEVATIFFRLLTDEVRDQYSTKDNSFSDVGDSNWYCRAVSTLAAMGIVNGYPNGSFAPNASITRAEFAAIAARFDKGGNTSSASFTDISGHWAEKEINIAANNGWVIGYTDGTFRPDRMITRAETMTLVNRVLQRIPELPSDLLSNMVTWPDNMDNTRWFYLAVQEATNSHDYERKANGYETWTQLREVRDWSALEK
ncbi:MAG: S-layer homology domain-containing protein [Bacillota bacterium]|nr:S-layer homology domain-containing protein [Bacillota bacterium]